VGAQRELGEALTFQSKEEGDSQNSCAPYFSATGSDPINPMTSAVPIQAGLLHVVSASLHGTGAGDAAQRIGLIPPLP
jgi:hypothetical protein